MLLTVKMRCHYILQEEQKTNLARDPHPQHPLRIINIRKQEQQTLPIGGS